MSEVDVEFSCECQAKPGEVIVVTGSLAAAGSWDPQSSRIRLVLQHGSSQHWVSSVRLPKGADFAFKYVVLGTSGTVWEDAVPDRRLGPLHSPVVYTCKFNAPGKCTPLVAPVTAGAASEEKPPVEKSPAAPPMSEEARKHASAIAEARQKREMLRTSITSRDAADKKAKQDVAAQEKVEAKSIEKLIAHSGSLESLLTQFASSAAARKEKAAEHQAGAKRLAEEKATLVAAIEAAKKRITEVKKSRKEAADQGAAAVAAAEDAEAEAEAAQAAAKQRQADIVNIVTELKARWDARVAESEAATRERDFRVEAAQTLAKESAAREAERQVATAKLRAATADLAAHEQIAMEDIRILENKLRRAEEVQASAEVLENSMSRKLLADQDRTSLAVAFQAAQANSKAAAEAVLVAEQHKSQALASTAAQRNRVVAAVQEAQEKLMACERIADSMAARLADREQMAKKAKMAQIVSLAVAEAASQEYEAKKERVSGPLAEEARRCEEAAVKARQAAEEARKTAAANVAPFRHQEEGELQALVQLEETEVKLSQALANATRLAKEADLEDQQAEAATAHADQAAQTPPKSVAKRVRVVSLSEEDDAKKDSAESTQDSAESTQSAEATESAPSQNVQQQSPTQASSENSPVQPKAWRPSSTEALVKKELEMIEALVKRHQGAEAELRAAAAQKAAEWQEERSALLVNLHLADLRLTALQEDMEAMLALQQPPSTGEAKSTQARSSSRTVRTGGSDRSMGA